MPHKMRFVIEPERMYVVKLSDGDVIEVSGLDIIQMGHSVSQAEKLSKLTKDEETGNNEKQD